MNGYNINGGVSRKQTNGTVECIDLPEAKQIIKIRMKDFREVGKL